jgi:hypothetical protein
MTDFAATLLFVGLPLTALCAVFVIGLFID